MRIFVKEKPRSCFRQNFLLFTGVGLKKGDDFLIHMWEYLFRHFQETINEIINKGSTKNGIEINSSCVRSLKITVIKNG